MEVLSLPKGAGFGFRAEVGGSGEDTRVFLEAEEGFREVLGVVERGVVERAIGVGGRGCVLAVSRESCVREARSSFSLFVVEFGVDARGGGGCSAAVWPEAAGAPE